MNVVYHASKIQGLSEIEPRESTHDKFWVYAMKKREESAMHLGSWSDLVLATGTINGTPFIAERFPNALEQAYQSKKGSIYTLSGSTFREDETSYATEIISEEQQPVLSEEVINDALDVILQLGNEGKIKIYKYPSLPNHVPADKSDLIEKYRGWKDSLVRKGKWEEVVGLIKKFHPELLDEILR